MRGGAEPDPGLLQEGVCTHPHPPPLSTHPSPLRYADVGKALSLAKKKVAQGGKLNNLAASELNADQVEKLKDFTNFKEEVKYLEVCGGRRVRRGCWGGTLCEFLVT